MIKDTCPFTFIDLVEQSQQNQDVIDTCPFTFADLVFKNSTESRPITYPGVELGRYTITENGIIYNRQSQKLVAQFSRNAGYMYCNLMTSDKSQSAFAVHRLVAWEWVLRDRNINLQVNHIDGNKLNNHYTNLEWKTKQTLKQARPITYPGVIPNTYTITREGIIYSSFYNKYLSSHIGNTGYVQCGLITIFHKQKTFSVHRLVAWEWVLKNRDINLQVNHIDGNKLNNHYTNLEWVTPAENAQHAIKTGLTPYRIHTKLTEEEVHEICKMLEDPDISYDQVASMYPHVCTATIIDIAHGRTWTEISSQYYIPHRYYEYPKGTNCVHSKLTEEQVHQVCKMLENPHNTYNSIIEQLNLEVGVHVISSINLGKTWQDISSQYNIVPRDPIRIGLASKLTDEEVHYICKRLQDPVAKCADIAEELGNKVCPHTIMDIRNGDTYTHISSQYNIPPRDKRAQQQGVANHSAVFDEDTVRFICEERVKGTKVTDIYKMLGNRFNISSISAIVNGYNWTHISKEYGIESKRPE